jgi:hypothetical protein
MASTRIPARTGRRNDSPDTPAAESAPDTTPTPATPDTAPAAPARTVPVYAAGCGNPDVVLKSASDAGFQCGLDENMTAWAVSPDGRLRLEFGPESGRYFGNPMGGLWLVTYTDAAEPRSGWRAQFGDNCPAEAIAAFVKALAHPSGLDPERADGGEADTEVTVTLQVTTITPDAARTEEQAGPATRPAPAQATAPTTA